MEPRIIDHFSLKYLRSVNGDHSSLLILKVDSIYVKNSIRKLNMRAIKPSGLQIELFTHVINEPVFKAKQKKEFA